LLPTAKSGCTENPDPRWPLNGFAQPWLGVEATTGSHAAGRSSAGQEKPKANKGAHRMSDEHRTILS
jgi:hypothetical protein